MGTTIFPTRVGYANVYLLRGPSRSVLVDTAFPGQAGRILAALARHGVSPGDVGLILLTHGHLDHLGSAAELRQRTGAPVAVHTLDAESVRLGSAPPQDAAETSGFLKVMFRVMARLGLGRATPLEPDIVFDRDWGLDAYGISGQVLHTPGHTPGSVSVLLDSGEAIVGDMVIGGFVRTRRPMEPFIVRDVERNRQSIRQLVEIGPRIVYSGHGGPFHDLARLHGGR